MAALRFIIGLIITISIALIAVLNRDIISFTWSPLHNSIDLPIYALILAPMAIGFIFGGAVVWINSSKLRKEKRKQKKNIKMLEKEVANLKEDKFTPAAPAIIVKEKE